MAEGGSITIKVLLDTSQFTASAQQVKSDLDSIDSSGLKEVDADAKGAGESMKGFSQKTTEAGSATKTWQQHITSAGKVVESVGSTLTKTLTPAIVGIGTASVAAAVSMDTSMTNVRKTVDGTEADYARLKQAAIDFSMTNAVSPQQILDIEALGAQLGFSIDELQEFGEVVSGLDIATNMNAEQAATEMAQFANITKMSHGEISNYGSAIVALGNNFATTESDISSMAMRLAAAGAQVGMSQADILGLATALTSMGVEAEAGGTAISTIMSAIDADVARASQTFEDLAASGEMSFEEIEAQLASNQAAVETWASAAGMSAEEFATAWRENPVEALGLLLAGMEDATNEGGNMQLMLDELGISSLRQTDVMKRLAGNSELVADAVKLSNEAWQENTALQDEVNNRNESLAAKFEMIKNRVIAVADAIGVPLANAFLSLLDQAEPLFQRIEEGVQTFAEMDAEQQQLIITVVALAAALGPVLTIGGKLMQTFGNISTGVQGVIQWLSKLGSSGTQASTSFEKMNTSTKLATTGLGAFKVALAGLGIAAAIAAVALLVEEFQKVDAVPAAARKMSDGFQEATDRIKGSSEEAKSSLKSIEDGTTSAASSFDKMKGEVISAMEGMTQATSDFNAAWDEIDATSAMVGGYVATIEELTSKTQLNADEQARLALAVQGYNEATGSNVEIIDGATGKLSENTEALKLNADAWQANARAQAAQQYATEVWKELIPLQQEAIAMADEYGISYERLSDGTIKFGQMSQEAHDKMQAAGWGTLEAWSALRFGVEDAQDMVQLANEAAIEGEKDYMQLSEAALQASSSFESLSDTLRTLDEAGGGALSTWAEETGTNLDEVAQRLSEFGFTVEELSSLNEEQLAALVGNWNMSAEEIKAICEEWGIEVPETLQQMAEGFTTSQDAMTQFIESTASLAEGSNLKQWAEESGVSVQELAQTLVDFGVSVEDAASLTTEQLGVMVENSGASLEELVAAFSAAGVEIPPPIQDAMSGVVDAVDEAKTPSEAGSQQLHDAIKSPLDPLPDELNVLGDEAGSNFASGLDGHVGDSESAAQSTYDAVDGALSQAPDMAQGYGDDAGSEFADGIDSHVGDSESAAQSHYDAVDSGLEPTPDQAQQYGDDTGSNFAEAIDSHVGDTESAAQANADATENMNNNSGSASSWGADLVSAFAAGISSMIGAVVSAACAVADAVASILHFTHPDEGPLKAGMEIHGRHLVENFASGIESRRDLVSDAAAGLAEDVRDQFTNLYDGLIELPDPAKLEGEGYKAMQFIAKGAQLGIGDIEPIFNRIDWYSTSGIYDKAQIIGFGEPEPTSFTESNQGERDTNITVYVNVDRIENSANEDGTKAAERVSREIAIRAAAKLKGTGRA